MRKFKAIELLYYPLATKVHWIMDEFRESTGVNLAVSETFRSPQRQQYLYEKGRSTAGPIVTKAQEYQSYHQYGLAIDFVADMSPDIPGIQDPYNAGVQWEQLGSICRKYDLRWGGQWGDMGHVEVITSLKTSQLRGILESGGNYGIYSVWRSVRVDEESNL